MGRHYRCSYIRHSGHTITVYFSVVHLDSKRRVGGGDVVRGRSVGSWWTVLHVRFQETLSGG